MSELLNYLRKTVGDAATRMDALTEDDVKSLVAGADAARNAVTNARTERKKMERTERAHLLVLARRISTDRAKHKADGTCEDWYRFGAYGRKRSMLIILADAGDELGDVPGFNAVNMTLLDRGCRSWRNELRKLSGKPPIVPEKKLGHCRRTQDASLAKMRPGILAFPELLDDVERFVRELREVLIGTAPLDHDDDGEDREHHGVPEDHDTDADSNRVHLGGVEPSADPPSDSNAEEPGDGNDSGVEEDLDHGGDPDDGSPGIDHTDLDGDGSTSTADEAESVPDGKDQDQWENFSLARSAVPAGSDQDVPDDDAGHLAEQPTVHYRWCDCPSDFVHIGEKGEKPAGGARRRHWWPWDQVSLRPGARPVATAGRTRTPVYRESDLCTFGGGERKPTRDMEDTFHTIEAAEARDPERGRRLALHVVAGLDLGEQWSNIAALPGFRAVDWSTWTLDLRTVKNVRMRRTLGWCARDSRVIRLFVHPTDNPASLMETLLHEMTHALVRVWTRRDIHGSEFRKTLIRAACDLKWVHSPVSLEPLCKYGPIWQLDEAIEHCISHHGDEYELPPVICAPLWRTEMNVALCISDTYYRLVRPVRSFDEVDWVAAAVEAALNDRFVVEVVRDRVALRRASGAPGALHLGDPRAGHVVRRMQKLLALATDQEGSPEGELARRRLERLAAEHGVSISEVGRGDRTQHAARAFLVKTKWERSLAHAVAKFHGCFSLTSSGGLVRFFGRADAVECARHMFVVQQGYFIRQEAIERKMRKAAGTWSMWSSARRARWRSHFFRSAVQALNARLTSIAESDRTAEPQTYELIKHDFAAAEQYAAYLGHTWGNGRASSLGMNAAGARAGMSSPIQAGISDRRGGGLLTG